MCFSSLTYGQTIQRTGQEGLSLCVVFIKNRDTDGDGILKIETDPLNRYCDEEKAFIDALPNKNPNDAYLFIVNIPNNLDARGYMPINAQYGFIFVNEKQSIPNEAYYQTSAHELGHGILKMKHVWEEYGTTERQTDNLMDYQNGSTLWEPQWSWIHHPGFRLYMFQDEGQGAFSIVIHKEILFDAMKSVGGYTTTPPFDEISFFLIDGVQATDFLGFAMDFHFDNKTNFNELYTEWTNLKQSFSKLTSSTAYKNGWLLHQLMDFYAHSNYFYF